MDVEFLHLVTGGAQIFTRVKLTGFVVEDLADGGGHCKTAVGVDVDLADCALGGLAELLFGNANCIGQLTAELVDDVYILLRDRAGAMDAVGIPEEQLREATKSAVCKINIDSDSRLAMTAAIRKAFAEKPAEFDPRKYLGPARDEMKKLYMHKIINVLGSDGKAE